MRAHAEEEQRRIFRSPGPVMDDKLALRIAIRILAGAEAFTVQDFTGTTAPSQADYSGTLLYSYMFAAPGVRTAQSRFFIDFRTSSRAGLLTSKPRGYDSARIWSLTGMTRGQPPSTAHLQEFLQANTVFGCKRGMVDPILGAFRRTGNFLSILTCNFYISSLSCIHPPIPQYTPT